LAGTFAYTISVKRLTIVTTGMWSIIYQFACISLSFGSLFVANYELSMVMLIAGVCLSRMGLWVFDIAANQLMHEFIPEGIRGVVGGTQQSLNAFFQLSSFALGFVFPDPHDFPIYASAGYALVGVAAVAYIFGVYVRKDDFLTETERRQRAASW
jgi:iron-regulated transporter 1